MAFLAPAIADFVLASVTLYRMIGVVDDSVVPRAQIAGVAFCWGVLLLVGMAKPVERKWVLLPTAMVIGCIAAAYCLGFLTGIVSLATTTLVLVLCGTMIWLCWAGMKHASKDHA